MFLGEGGREGGREGEREREREREGERERERESGYQTKIQFLSFPVLRLLPETIDEAFLFGYATLDNLFIVFWLCLFV